MSLDKEDIRSKIDIKYFENIISAHFYREMEIMLEMFEANLSEEEWKEIRTFILNHPHHEIVKLLGCKT